MLIKLSSKAMGDVRGGAIGQYCYWECSMLCKIMCSVEGNVFQNSFSEEMMVSF